MPKDKILHIAFIAAIILLGALLYFSITSDKRIVRDEFLSESDKFNAEIGLQEIPERILPGSLKVPILIYHSIAPHRPNQTSIQRYYDVAPGSFEKQLKYLRDNNYVVLGLDFLADALTQSISLPPKPVIITLDDGWENQFKYAYPLLKKYGYTATFFIFTHGIDTEGFLTWDEIKTMDDGGMSIGGHTRTHPYLPAIIDPVVLRREIIGGKSIIENRLGRPINLFAYPFGYYNDQIIEIVKEAGYKAARSAYYGIHNSPEEIYKLKGVEATDDFDKFVKDLNG